MHTTRANYNSNIDLTGENSMHTIQYNATIGPNYQRMDPGN